MERVYALLEQIIPNTDYRTATDLVDSKTLTSLNWDFTPKVKEVTQLKTRTVRPFVGLGYNTFNQASVTGGVFIRNIGLSATYISDFAERRSGIGLRIMIEL